MFRIIWSKHYKEFIAAHDIVGGDQLLIWGYPSMEKMAELPGHSAGRPIYLAMSPNGQTVVSASGEEEQLRVSLSIVYFYLVIHVVLEMF